MEEMLGAMRNFTMITPQVESSKIKENNISSQRGFHQAHRNIESEKVENERIVSPSEIVDSTLNHFTSTTTVGSSPTSPIESSNRSRSRSVSPFSNLAYITRSANFDAKDGMPNESIETNSRSPNLCISRHNKRGKEVIEQFEPGVYITAILLQDGTKIFKRVRFR